MLGDKDQLVSVESGAVLADLVEALPDNTVELKTTYRFHSAIAQLSEAVNCGDIEAVRQLLSVAPHGSTQFLREPIQDYAGRRYRDYMDLVARVGEIGEAPVFAAFNTFRVLCALRRGPAGVEGVTAMVEQFLSRGGYDCANRVWYPGRPVLITRNDYAQDLANGDIGLTLPDPKGGGLRVAFQRPDGSFRFCVPYRLPPCETAYALTIHKCQGSEFDDVLVVLPDDDNRVLSRELVYTAVTRARRKVLLRSGDEALCRALGRKTRRHSNLRERLTAE